MNELIKKISSNKELIFLQDEAYSYSYSDLLDKIVESSKVLKTNHIKPHSVVLIIGDYSLHSIALILALIENKNIIVPIASQSSQEQLDFFINESTADYIVTSKDLNIKKVDTNAEKNILITKLTLQDDAGLILFSSGSTGKPKSMIHNFTQLLSSYRDTKVKNKNYLLFLMFDHIGGINTLFHCLYSLATMVVCQKRTPKDICYLIQKHKINILPTTPTFLNMILLSNAHHEYDLSSLILVTYGTEKMSIQLLERLRKSFKKVRFIQTYGTSETGILKTISKPNSNLFKFQDDIEYKIINDELWIKSSTTIDGYINYENKMDETKWFNTHDIVQVDNDGYIKVVSRQSDIINVGGEKVNPLEIEQVLYDLDEIVDVIVYALPHKITGECVACDVILNKDLTNNLLRKKIIAISKERLSRFQIPTYIRIIQDIQASSRFKRQINHKETQA